MRSLNPNFAPEYYPPSEITANFLDKFVGLYKRFFKVYEESLCFKTRVESYVRATNVSMG